MAISLALKVNRSLVRIDLDKELRKEPVSITLAFCLSFIPDDAEGTLLQL